LKTGRAYSFLFLILTPFFYLGGTFSGFSQNSFEKWQMAACYFSKEFPVNPRNVSTNKKRGIALCCFQFTFKNSKGFGVKQLRTYEFNINEDLGGALLPVISHRRPW
jgi:hypothetical protein